MHLFYQPHLGIDRFELTEEESRHCSKVLRLAVGDIIHVTDGLGKMIKGRIDRISKSNVEGVIIESNRFEKEKFSVHLYIAPTKQMERMEWLVEKLCEIGIEAITFVQTQNAERPQIKLDRLIKKSISALKQSKGAWMTQIHEMIPFEQAIHSASTHLKLIAAVQPNQNVITEVIKKHQTIAIFIGPEGDFTTDELRLAVDQGLVPVSLGNKVLRTETAGLYSCSAVHLLNS